jgi:hypothetical protein
MGLSAWPARALYWRCSLSIGVGAADGVSVLLRLLIIGLVFFENLEPVCGGLCSQCC